MRIATFNVQNLRLRRLDDGRTTLKGARDDDTHRDHAEPLRLHDRADRKLTAAVLHDIDADIVALQEVHDQETLDFFHDQFLQKTGLRAYEHRICLPGNDAMGRNLALLSRIAPTAVTSHKDVLAANLGVEAPATMPPDRPLFCRDCLVVDFDAITLFLCHFKAPYPNASATFPFRRMEALGVRHLVERHFVNAADVHWLILGDLNEPVSGDPDAKKAMAPLLGGFSVDLLERRPKGQRWSYHEPTRDTYSRPDAMLASPALAIAWPEAYPRLVREGMGQDAALFPGPRMHGVGQVRPHASDHAAVVIDFDGL